MPYCPKCGVEVNSQQCPLCHYEIKQDIHTVPFSHEVSPIKKVIILTNKEKKRIFNASFIFFALLVSSICITTDYILDRTLSWSIYPIITVMTMALITTVSLYVHGFLKGVIILILSLLMLFIFDITLPIQSFFLQISLPIAFSGAIIALLISVIIRNSKTPGVNVPAYIIIGVSLLTIIIDLITGHYITGLLQMTWSLITTVSLMPIAIFLLYIHFVLSKRIDLSKIFHA